MPNVRRRAAPSVAMVSVVVPPCPGESEESDMLELPHPRREERRLERNSRTARRCQLLRRLHWRST